MTKKSRVLLHNSQFITTICHEIVFIKSA